MLEKYKTPEPTVEFISYDGKYPNLCSGTLVFSIDGEVLSWNYCLSSGGSTNWHEGTTTSGEWTVDFPEGFPDALKPYITDMVNQNIWYGCCGGCI